jgi:hypothetical protein
MNVKFDFTGQVAVISGGATAWEKPRLLNFAKAGAGVAICDINPIKGQATVDEIKALGEKPLSLKWT